MAAAQDAGSIRMAVTDALRLAPSIRHVECPHGFLLGALPTPIILGRGLHVGMPQQLLHGDQINVVIEQITGDGTSEGKREA